jgi:hypothetical protein
MKTQPELEAFEAELKKYMAIETEVLNISPVYNIGELTGLVESRAAHLPSRTQLRAGLQSYCAGDVHQLALVLVTGAERPSMVCLQAPCRLRQCPSRVHLRAKLPVGRRALRKTCMASVQRTSRPSMHTSGEQHARHACRSLRHQPATYTVRSCVEQLQKSADFT